MLYGTILQLRNWFYDWGIFKSESFDVPVISVGNITAGGTGKTPFTIFLARQLAGQFKKIVIVSRGYGRKSTGLQLVAARGQVYLDAAQAGDEPYVMACSLADSVIIVSEKRAEGIQLAVDKFQADLIILDDAFQHRSVKRDLDILLINAKEPWQGNFPIPAGTLREFKFNYQRAQVVVFTNTDSDTVLPFKPDKQPFFKSTPQLNEVIDIHNKVVGKIEDFQSKKVLAFAGISHPDIFFSALEEQNIKPALTVAFRDHHIFTAQDLDKLIARAKKTDCEALFCTEKDLVKIQMLNTINSGISIFALRLTLIIENENQFEDSILQNIRDDFH